jgi:hypothetical protein
MIAHYLRRSCALAVLTSLLSMPALASDSLQRGVVLDRVNAQVLLMRASGGMEAIDLRSGQTRWTSTEADLPVLANEDQLLALRSPAEAGVLQVAFIDLATGQTRAQQSAPLPRQAMALIDDRLGQRFDIAVRRDAEGFDWYYEARHVSGAKRAPAPAPNGAENKQVPAASAYSGHVSVDFQTAKLATSTATVAKALDVAAVELAAPKATGARRFRSGSGLSILASERMESLDYRWQLSQHDGSQLGELSSEYSYLPFEVHDGILLFTTPLRVRSDKAGLNVEGPTLVAFDLAKGMRIWTREIRDTVYRGPYPP